LLQQGAALMPGRNHYACHTFHLHRCTRDSSFLAYPHTSAAFCLVINGAVIRPLLHEGATWLLQAAWPNEQQNLKLDVPFSIIFTPL